MSENSKKAARVNSLKKKLQVRRAATGGPKGDFYIIGGAVKDEYDGLFVMERYHGKSIVVCLGPKSNDTKNPYQEVIRDEIIKPRKKTTYAFKNMSDLEIVRLVVSQEGIPADQVELVSLRRPTGRRRVRHMRVWCEIPRGPRQECRMARGIIVPWQGERASQVCC